MAFFLDTERLRPVIGFFKSILLRNVNTLQDSLRLLTLLFKYGANDDVSQAIAAGFTTVEVDTWLEVIPQIIARIQTPISNIRRNIDQLLTVVGKHHPQALVYPLTVAAKSSSAVRRRAAQGIMDRIREHSPIIVDQVRDHYTIEVYL
jgi:serine/threonine-protein kinase mTOR